MRDIILYYNCYNTYYDKYIFYDIMSNLTVDISKIVDKYDINNVWVDYDSFDNSNDIKSLIKWILRKKYSLTCPVRDIKEIEEKYINLYKNYREEVDEWDIL